MSTTWCCYHIVEYQKARLVVNWNSADLVELLWLWDIYELCCVACNLDHIVGTLVSVLVHGHDLFGLI